MCVHKSLEQTQSEVTALWCPSCAVSCLYKFIQNRAPMHPGIPTHGSALPKEASQFFVEYCLHARLKMTADRGKHSLWEISCASSQISSCQKMQLILTINGSTLTLVKCCKGRNVFSFLSSFFILLIKLAAGTCSK